MSDSLREMTDGLFLEKDIRNDRKGGTGRRFSSRTQLRISVYGDGDEMLSDIDELEKGNVDKVLQANGSAVSAIFE